MIQRDTQKKSPFPGKSSVPAGTNRRQNGGNSCRAAFILRAALFLLVLWSQAVPPALTAAEISLPKLELGSRGRMSGGEFVLSSVINADIALSGGYKYSFLLGFSLEAADIARAFAYRNFKVGILAWDPVTGPDMDLLLERYNALADRLNNQAFLGFRIAKATARDIFGLPLELSWFLGSGDDFCTGGEFTTRYGLSPIGTDFRGFFYFPDGIGGMPLRQYNGIYGVRGTGLSLTLTRWDTITPMLYLYQDFAYTPETINPDGSVNPGSVFGDKHLYSGDLRMLFRKGWLNLEAFGGVSLNSSLDTSLRLGLMVHIAPGNGAEFFAQAGIPGWTAGDTFSIDNIFFLIEPRLHFGLLGIFVTFFYHPVEYIHVLTPEERGKADMNIKFRYGKADSGAAGGIELRGNLKLDGPQDFTFQLSPFVSFISGGLRWDAKFLVTPQNYRTPEEMFEIFIGVRTAF